jgi:hypothetical protein
MFHYIHSAIHPVFHDLPTNSEPKGKLTYRQLECPTGMTVRQAAWQTGVIVRQTDWLTDWRTDGLADWLIDRMTDEQTNWPICWLVDWQSDWSTGWLTDWQSERQKEPVCMLNFESSELWVWLNKQFFCFFIACFQKDWILNNCIKDRSKATYKTNVIFCLKVETV